MVVGCGELGSRHVQAIAALDNIGEVHVVDSREESLALGKRRLREITDQNSSIKFFWHTRADECCVRGDLCIVATQAKGRCAVVKEIAKKCGYKKFLVEKIAAQSREEYQELMRFAAERNFSIWVNCKTRAYGVHRYIKSKLDPKEPIFFSDVGGSHGLANNGVHAADLFAFYDNATAILPVGARIDPAVFSSKRGPDVFDLGGTLYGRTEKGSDFILSYSSRHAAADVITIMSPHGRFLVDHFQKFAYESYPETNWKWMNIPIDENWAVSHMTTAFATDILTKHSCLLPTLHECFPAHQYILTTLLPHFNALRGTDDTFCPVT